MRRIATVVVTVYGPDQGPELVVDRSQPKEERQKRRKEFEAARFKLEEAERADAHAKLDQLVTEAKAIFPKVNVSVTDLWRSRRRV